LLLVCVIFALHCTPLLDTLSRVPDARGYLGVSQVVQIAVGVLCTVVTVETSFILYSITCGYSSRKRFIMMENRSAAPKLRKVTARALLPEPGPFAPLRP